VFALLRSILYSVIYLRSNGVIRRTQKVIQGDDNCSNVLLLRNRAHQRIYTRTTLPLFRRTLLFPTGIIPLTGLVCLNIYNV
jgi:hypothetical protein